MNAAPEPTHPTGPVWPPPVAPPAPKDPTVAILLTVFFGTLGLGYTHGAGVAILASIGAFVLTVLTLGLAIFFVWPAAIVVGYLKAKELSASR